MGKQPTQAQRAEYARLRVFIQTAFESGVFGDVTDLPADAHPAAVLDRLWARSPAKALKGLRAAASDVVDATQDWDDVLLGVLEARLAAAGAPSLAAMRDRRVRQIFEVLRRGGIKTEEEARLLLAVVGDTADRVLDAPATELANALLGQYEGRRRPSEG